MIEIFVYGSVLLNFAVLAALGGLWVHVQIQGYLDGGYQPWRHLVWLGCLFVFFMPGYLHLAFSISCIVGILAVVGAAVLMVAFGISTIVSDYQHRRDGGFGHCPVDLEYRRGANVALKDED